MSAGFASAGGGVTIASQTSEERLVLFALPMVDISQ
jgi:hypothetical protein